MAFICEGGCLVFACQEPGIYEVHIAFLPEYRGSYAKQAFLIASRLMFMTTPAITLLIRIPDNNPAGRFFYAGMGAKQEFRREAIWPTHDGHIGQSYWTIRYDDWILSNEEMLACGAMFIDQLSDFSGQLGHAGEEFDPCAQRYLGAFMLMGCAGQVDKAVILFNRFAGFANLGRFILISREPSVVDTGATLLQFVDNDFKVLLCR